MYSSEVDAQAAIVGPKKVSGKAPVTIKPKGATGDAAPADDADGDRGSG
jgi:hypothetical protein